MKTVTKVCSWHSLCQEAPACHPPGTDPGMFAVLTPWTWFGWSTLLSLQVHIQAFHLCRWCKTSPQSTVSLFWGRWPSQKGASVPGEARPPARAVQGARVGPCRPGEWRGEPGWGPWSGRGHREGDRKADNKLHSPPLQLVCFQKPRLPRPLLECWW